MKQINNFILLLFALVIGIQPIYSQTSSPQPTVTMTIKNETSIPLKDIPPHPPGVGIENENKEKKQDREPTIYDMTNALPKGPDQAWQSIMGTREGRSPYINFAGVQNNDNTGRVAPPDTDGEVGPDHFFQMCNCIFEIFDREGTSLYGPANTTTLWDSYTGPWTGEPIADPVVLYDEDADRWFASVFTTTAPGGNYYILLALTTTGDPLGSWYLYAVAWSTKPDYAKYSVWPDGYYMGCNTGGNDVAVLQRSTMLAGSPTMIISFDNPQRPNSGFHAVMPSDCDGPFPPAGTPNYFVTINDDAWGGNDEIRMWEFHVDWTTPGNSTWTYLTPLSPTSFSSAFAGGWSNIPQPGTGQKLDAIPEVLMFRAQHRYIGGVHRIVCNHTVDVDGFDHAGIRWYELRKTGSSWSIYQQSTYAPDASHRWMGSIAMNIGGDIALGYSISSTSVYPSIRYTGRQSGDALNQMTFNEMNIFTGSASQTTINRWGDYSLMSVDPVDNFTFWYTQEYVGTYGGWCPWASRICAFDLDCWASVTYYVEYISNVNVGTINNSSGWSSNNGYGDYRHLSTSMHQGSPYSITITIGNNNYPQDQGAVWVDWNTDGDYNDANETITPINGSPGNGPYTATIVPPLGTVNGPKTMRVRLNYNAAPPSCGNTSYGEVEDYTIVVEDPTPNIWEGDFNYYWSNANNWSLGHVPISTEDVTIPNTYTYYPYVHGTTLYDAACNNLTMNSGTRLRINNATLTISEDMVTYGLVEMVNDNAVLTVEDDIVWHSGSSANITHDALMEIYDNWDFRSGANVNITNGTAKFMGSGSGYIRTYDSDCWFHRIYIYKTSGAFLGHSAASTEAMKIHDYLHIHSSGGFISNSSEDIILGGNFYNNDVCNLDYGTIVFEGSNHAIYFNSPGYFNNVKVNPTGIVSLNTNIDIHGNLLIEQGTLNPNGNTINIQGDWTNTVGTSGFTEGSGRVIFDNPSDHSYIHSDETFNILEVDISAALRVDNVSHTVTCNSYDWTSGGIDVLSGTFTALDLADNGLFGGYWLNPTGTINLTQDGFSYTDIEGEVHIFGGVMNVFGGNGDSFWSYYNNIIIEMSDGILDFHDQGIYVYDNGYNSVTENITGGTIKTSEDFRCDRGDFTPTGGTIECYGSDGGSLTMSSGSNFHNLHINKSSDALAFNKLKPHSSKKNPISDIPSLSRNLNKIREQDYDANERSRATLTLGSDLDINGNLTINGGVLDVSVSDYDIYLEGNWTNTVGSSAFNERNGDVRFDGNTYADITTNETFYGFVLNKTSSGYDALELSPGITVDILEHVAINDGSLEMNTSSTLNIGGDLSIYIGAGLNANDNPTSINIGGDWSNNNTNYSSTYGFDPGVYSTVTFNGSSDQFLYTSTPQEEFNDLVIDNSSVYFRPGNNIWVSNQLHIIHGEWWDVPSSLSHTFAGDFTIDAGAGFYGSTSNTVNFVGTNYQQINFDPASASGYFRHVVIDKTPITMLRSISDENYKKIPVPGNNDNRSDIVRLNTDLQGLNLGNLTITEGVLDLNGHYYRCTGHVIVSDGGTLSIDDNAWLEVGNGHNLVVSDGGLLEVIGSSGNEAMIKAHSGNYNFDVYGTLSAEHAVFKNTGLNGVYVASVGTVDPTHSLTNCTFRDGITGYGTLLLIDNDQFVDIYNADFPTSVTTFNVAKTLDQGTINLYNATGIHAGPNYELDAFNRIHWDGEGQWIGVVSSDWNTPGNWKFNFIPDALTDVTIPAGTPHDPVMSTGLAAVCNNLTIDPGASVTLGADTLIVNGDFLSFGNLTLNSTSSRMWIYGETYWDAGSTASMTASSTLYVYSHWEFRSGANVQLSDGYVDFQGTDDSWVRGYDPDCHFYHIRNHKTFGGACGRVMFSNLSTYNIYVNGNFYNYSGNYVGFSNNNMVVFNGYFNNMGGHFNGYNGTVAFMGLADGVDFKPNTGDYFNNLVIISTTPLNLSNIYSDSLVIRGDLLINDPGTKGTGLISNGLTITIEGSWVNLFGDAGFGETGSKVIFTGDGYQYCNGDIFDTLVMDKSDGLMIFPVDPTWGYSPPKELSHPEFLDPEGSPYDENYLSKESSELIINAEYPINNISNDTSARNGGTVTVCSYYDWVSGTMSVQGGTFTANDIPNSTGIEGIIYLENGELNLHQGVADVNWIDLNADLTIYDGVMNVFGGSLGSWWPYNNNSSLTMSGGILNFANQGIFINEITSYTFTENITGGLIKTSKNFRAEVTDFTPTGGEVNLYGPVGATIEVDPGSKFYDLTISKGSSDEKQIIITPQQDERNFGNSKSNSDRIVLPNSVDAISSIFILNDLVINEGTFNLNGNTVEVNQDVDIFGTLQMTNAIDSLKVNSDLTWRPGSSDDITAGDIFVSTNWSFLDGTNAQLGTGNTVHARGAGTSRYLVYDADAELGNLAIDKGIGNARIHTATQPLRVAGNFTVGPGDYFWYYNQQLIVDGTVDIQNGGLVDILSTGMLTTNSPFNLFGEFDLGSSGNATIHGIFDLAPTGILTIGGGNFICDAPPAKGIIDLDGTLNLTAGVFESTDNHIDVNTTFTDNISGGTIKAGASFLMNLSNTFQPSGGTVEFTNDYYGPYMQSDPSNYFYNLKINNSSTIMLHSDIYVDHAVDIIAGTLSSNNYNLYVGGDWTNSVGNSGFNEGNDTVFFYGPNVGTIHTDETFSNVVVNKVNAIPEDLIISEHKTITINEDLITINGMLELNDSTTLDVDGRVRLLMNSGINAYGDLGLNIYVGGNWENSNPDNSLIRGFIPGTSTVTFDGEANQYLIGSSLTTEDFYNLTVDIYGWTFYTNNNVQVFGDFILDNTWFDVSDGMTHYFHGDITVTPLGMWGNMPNQTVVFKGYENQNFYYDTPGAGFFSNIVVDKTPSKSLSSEESSIIQEINENDNRIPGQRVVLQSTLMSQNNGTVTIDEGTLYLNGHTLYTSGNIDVNDGGILHLNDNSLIIVEETRTLSVNNGGYLLLDGGPVNQAKITHVTVGYYNLNINPGGQIAAEHTIFEYTGQNGVCVNDGATVYPDMAFNQCIFRYGDPSTNATLLKIENSQNLNILDASFPTITGGGAFNVTKTLDQGHLTFENATGSFSGESYENDAFARIDWITVQPELSVTPDYRDVPDTNNVTKFFVDNTGTGTMHWSTYLIPPASEWLSILSGSYGTDNDTIVLGVETNTWDARTGKLVIFAPDALYSPDTVEVRQAVATTYVVLPSDTINSGEDTCYDATKTITVPITGGSYLVESGGMLSLVAGETITVKTGFKAEEGSYFHAFISGAGCPVFKEFPLVGVIADIKTSGNIDLINIYPNPTDGLFTIEIIGNCAEEFQIEVYNILGMKMLEKEVQVTEKLIMNLADNAEGIYIIKTVCGNEVYVKKLIKQ